MIDDILSIGLLPLPKNWILGLLIIVILLVGLYTTHYYHTSCFLPNTGEQVCTFGSLLIGEWK